MSAAPLMLPTMHTLAKPLVFGAVQLGEFAMLRLTDRPAWRKRVLAALKRQNGSRTLAAKELGVPLRTLQKWLANDASLRAAAPAGTVGRPWPKGDGSE